MSRGTDQQFEDSATTGFRDFMPTYNGGLTNEQIRKSNANSKKARKNEFYYDEDDEDYDYVVDDDRDRNNDGDDEDEYDLDDLDYENYLIKVDGKLYEFIDKLFLLFLELK